MEQSHSKHLILGIMATGFVMIGLVIFFLWYFIFEYESTTKDAYVHGNQVVVTAQTSGFVDSIFAEESQVVLEGAVLAKLDPTDNEIAFQKAIHHLAQTVRNVEGLYQKVEELRAERERVVAEEIKATQDYNHRKHLLQSGGVSREEFEHAEAEFRAISATLAQINHQLEGALAQTINTTVTTHPSVEAAKDQVRTTYLNLERCTVRSPTHGMVAQRRVQVGEAITPSDPLMMIVPLDQVWVNANFKETELSHVRIGQPVTMESDIYGRDAKYHGEVIGLTAGTGSVFSILPPQNATGNWIKIVQRLPVRVSLDPQEVAQHPLRLGLSMKVTIDTRDRTGQFNPNATITESIYQTEIFEKQMDGVETIISEVIQENLLQ